MMGKLFAHGVSPTEIETMTYKSLNYWSKWADAVNKQNTDALKGMNA
jgi:hypothetical protein